MKSDNARPAGQDEAASGELHCHTMFSVDGHGTPEEAVDRAAEQGIDLLAVTDHNTIDAIDRAGKQASARGIRLLPGVEIDARWREGKHHFLALGVDPTNRRLRDLLAANFSIYEASFEVLLRHFGDYGYRVERGRLEQGLPGRYPTHPAPVLNMWFARSLLVGDVFPDRATFQAVVERIRNDHAGEMPDGFGSLEQTVDVVREAGGVLLLAHVSQYRGGDPAGQVELIRDVVEAGVDGFELYHPDNVADPGFETLRRLADDLACAVSGGSDCHDARLTGAGGIGSLPAPAWVLERLESALHNRRTEGAS